MALILCHLGKLRQRRKANLAAVNYHFGSKEELVLAVICRWIRPLNRKRLDLLEALENRDAESPSVAEIAEAFVRPALEMYRQSEQSKAVFLRLLGRCMLETREGVSSEILEEFREVIDRFGVAIRRCVPQLSPQDVTMRMMFMAGSMVHTILNLDKLEAFHGKQFAQPSTERLIKQLVEFVSAGLPGFKEEEAFE